MIWRAELCDAAREMPSVGAKHSTTDGESVSTSQANASPLLHWKNVGKKVAISAGTAPPTFQCGVQHFHKGFLNNDAKSVSAAFPHLFYTTLFF